MRTHTLRWKNPEAKGYTDVLPMDYYLSRSIPARRNLSHVVRSSRLAAGLAWFQLSIRKSVAELDYYSNPVHAKFNARDWYLGKLRLRFDSLAFEQITGVEWFDKGGDRWENVQKDVEIGFVDELFDVDVLESFASEGRTVTREHLIRERNPRLIAAKKRSANSLACEVCGLDFLARYGELGLDFCEVHHRVPLANGERATTLDDLAIVCSNCHRMLHRLEDPAALDRLRASLR